MSPDFAWSKRSLDAAELMSRGDRTLDAIAAKVGVNPRTLDRWRTHPTFQAKVAEHVESWKREVRATGIAVRENRIAALNRREVLLEQVITERARSGEYATVAGGETGLLVRQLKIGRDGTVIEEYAVDTGLLAEMRAHEKQAAQELQQWVEKVAQTDPTGTKEYGRDTLEAVIAAERAFIAARRQPAPLGGREGDDRSPAEGQDPV